MPLGVRRRLRRDEPQLSADYAKMHYLIRAEFIDAIALLLGPFRAGSPGASQHDGAGGSRRSARPILMKLDAMADFA